MSDNTQLTIGAGGKPAPAPKLRDTTQNVDYEMEWIRKFSDKWFLTYIELSIPAGSRLVDDSERDASGKIIRYGNARKVLLSRYARDVAKDYAGFSPDWVFEAWNYGIKKFDLRGPMKNGQREKPFRRFDLAVLYDFLNEYRINPPQAQTSRIALPEAAHKALPPKPKSYTREDHLATYRAYMTRDTSDPMIATVWGLHPDIPPLTAFIMKELGKESEEFMDIVKSAQEKFLYDHCSQMTTSRESCERMMESFKGKFEKDVRAKWMYRFKTDRDFSPFRVYLRRALLEQGALIVFCEELMEDEI